MTDSTELETGSATLTTATVANRRRPGRIADVSPELIPLLRGQEHVPMIEFEEIDENAAARGLFFGVLLSAPVWIGIAYAGSWFLS